MEKRIYTRRLAAYLFARGFKPIRTEPDARKEWYMNWFFEDIWRFICGNALRKKVRLVWIGKI